MELEQVLQTAIQLVEKIRGKEKELDMVLGEMKNAQIQIADQRMVLSIREEKLAGLENAAAALAQAKELQANVVIERQALEESRVEFQNQMVVEKQKLREEETALYPLRELAEQIRKDKVALEEEKKTYKEKLRTELLNQLKAGKI